ncbi:MAG: HAD family hydrolase [Proteobacteria bacterium]|nr:MAG: HAD family hydrolase [Pseudomonadota bacterium]
MPIEIPPPPPPSRGIYCNRTVNLKAIGAVGYDMDYTLIHYHVQEWERRAYEFARDRLADGGLPVAHLRFDCDLVDRGLILDTHLGNTVKADRFGYIKAAAHGTRMLDFPAVRETYGRVYVDLREERWVFLSTLFDISLSVLYGQCVDLLDDGVLERGLGYRGLFDRVRAGLDSAHIEGKLKAEIIDNPDAFVDLDPDGPRTLLDQKRAGKRLMLITNSEWRYTAAMMKYAFDRYLPDEMTWRDLFDLVIVQARKPAFFTTTNPLYEVINDEGHLRPVVGLPQVGKVYYGGHAALIEQALGLSGRDILYVGDHVFSDVNVTKSTVRWRTALVLRELEGELDAVAAFASDERRLGALMAEKAELDRRVAWMRLMRLRLRCGEQGPPRRELEAAIADAKQVLVALDHRLRPLAARAATLRSARWGPVMRAGIDKSHLARQIERYADVYTSRVSNFLHATPYVYLRAPKSSLSHDI